MPHSVFSALHGVNSNQKKQKQNRIFSIVANILSSLLIFITLEQQFQRHSTLHCGENCRIRAIFTNFPLFLPEHVFLAAELARQKDPDQLL